MLCSPSSGFITWLLQFRTWTCHICEYPGINCNTLRSKWEKNIEVKGSSLIFNGSNLTCRFLCYILSCKKLKRLKVITSLPVTSYLGEESDSHFTVTFFQVVQGPQDFSCFRKSNCKCGWEETCLKGKLLLVWDLSTHFWHHASTARASVLLWALKEMSVTQLKDGEDLWGWESSRVTWFRAVSLIFCLASETYFTRRWERTWNKIDLGWANIWRRSVGNNHLSWEISNPGDIDGTKNISLSPQSQGT